MASFQRRQWHPIPVLLPGKSHGQRSLVGCSSWGRDESDTTERLHFHFSVLCIGEGNGNPLQCSCLENPRDGVAQSDTTALTQQQWPHFNLITSLKPLSLNMGHILRYLGLRLQHMNFKRTQFSTQPSLLSLAIPKLL